MPATPAEAAEFLLQGMLEKKTYAWTNIPWLMQNATKSVNHKSFDVCSNNRLLLIEISR